jgi:hypothetical protein
MLTACGCAIYPLFLLPPGFAERFWLTAFLLAIMPRGKTTIISFLPYHQRICLTVLFFCSRKNISWLRVNTVGPPGYPLPLAGGFASSLADMDIGGAQDSSFVLHGAFCWNAACHLYGRG